MICCLSVLNVACGLGVEHPVAEGVLNPRSRSLEINLVLDDGVEGGGVTGMSVLPRRWHLLWTCDTR